VKEPIKRAWALLFAVIALIQFAYDYRPRIDIESAEFADRGDPISAFFRIKNVGHLSALHLDMSCLFFDGGVPKMGVRGSAKRKGNDAVLGPALIERLSPDESATRDCFAFVSGDEIRKSIHDMGSVSIDVRITYTWPLIGISGFASRHFSTRRTSVPDEYLLVPDSAQ